MSHYLFPSHEGNMAVSLMHRWHDSRAGEWWPVPSLTWLVTEMKYLADWGAWMHPRFVTCFRGIYHYYILVLGDWWCVRYTSFTAWELATPTLEASPHIILGVPRSPLRIHGYLIYLTWLDLILDLTWARGGILFPLPLFLTYSLTLVISYIVPLLHSPFVISLLLPCYLYICSLSFLTSAAFLSSAAGLLEGSWDMSEECIRA